MNPIVRGTGTSIAPIQITQAVQNSQQQAEQVGLVSASSTSNNAVNSSSSDWFTETGWLGFPNWTWTGAGILGLIVLLKDKH